MRGNHMTLSRGDWLNRIAEAELWYLRCFRPNKHPLQFRSLELRPGTVPDFSIALDNWVQVVDSVCLNRKSLVTESLPKDVSNQALSGRLLVYDPAFNLRCGGAEVATEGFFDTDNIPPWDLWIGYVVERELKWCFDSYLVSWVPNSLVALAEKGIQANPEGCIAWADSVRPNGLRDVL